MKSKIVMENQSLKQYCSYKTGGNALYFALPNTTEELVQLIQWSDALKIPHEIIGCGSNILFSDDGYEGLIISLKFFENWCVQKGGTVLAGAGAKLNDVVQFACANGLEGMENLAGIPGSVGGAVKMNAGAFGTEIKDIVSRINILTAKGELQHIRLEQELIYAGEAEFEYRQAKGLMGKIVLAAEFELLPSTVDLNARRKEILTKRAEKQPLNMPSCGSVFKRPQNGYAGALIEECGLKGYQIGGARVSEKHANFIVNTGNATSSDIYNLIKHVQREVLIHKKVLLEEEVRYIGNFKQNVL